MTQPNAILQNWSDPAPPPVRPPAVPDVVQHRGRRARASRGRNRSAAIEHRRRQQHRGRSDRDGPQHKRSTPTQTRATSATRAGSAGTGTNWYTTCIGKGTSATGQGGVAIGIDHLGNSATAAQDVVALGTSNHQVQILNNITGAGTPALGANCPATTLTAPYKWFKMMTADGSTVYVPAWK